MKKTVRLFLLLVSLCLGSAAPSWAQIYKASQSFAASPVQDEFSVFTSITKYLAAGDVNSLSSWFADNLDITVISSSRNCSRNQARQILRTFFRSYTPRSFEITHKASDANKKYMIGLLNAGGELFQVTIYATSSGGDTYKIQQLNISRQTAY